MTSRSEALRWLGLAGLYLALTLPMVNPFFAIEHIATACLYGDVRLTIWILAWVNHATLDGVRPLFDANIFHPATNTLALSEHLVGISIFTLPIYAATRNPVLSHNVAWLLSFPAAALAMHLVTWRVLRSHAAALVSGTVFAFSTFRLTHAGHIQLLWSFGIPLAFVAVDQWVRTPGWARAIRLGVLVVLQALCSWYLAVIGTLAVTARGVWQTWFTLRDEPARRTPAFLLRAIGPLLAAGLVSALVVWPFAEPYTHGQLQADLSEASRYSADAASYLMPPADTWLGRQFRAHGVRNLRLAYGEQTLFLGYVAMALALIGTLVSWRDRQLRRDAVFYVGMALVSLLLSFGPAGWGVPERWSPYGLASAIVPGLSLARGPARFALLITMAVSFLAGVGARALAGSGARRHIIAFALVALAAGELRFVEFPPGRPVPAPIPAIYRRFDTLPAGAVVSLPIIRDQDLWWLNADYQYYSTAHWRPIVNGYSRTQPSDYSWISGHMLAFPGPNSANTMRRLGVRYVVLHADRYPDRGAAVLQEAKASNDFQLIGEDEGVYLFRVQPAEAP
jgi:hypothetical protein